MKAHAELKYIAAHEWRRHGAHSGLRQLLRGIDVNWYQVAVVAVATFAVAMDLMFPPVRVAIGQSFDVYAGHAFAPVATMGVVQVDFLWLAVELMAIIAAAVVGWCIGTPAGDRRKSARDPD